MNHWLVVPILLPLATGAFLLAQANRSMAFKRSVSVGATLLFLLAALRLLPLAGEGATLSYAVGSWVAPFGIVLVLDRLAVLMLLVTGLLALGAVLYAIRGSDTLGRNFHALFQFQLLGLAGAFLTGDIFNLFVFFEILLIASYSLLLHGQGPARARAGLHYVVLNLIGSTLFLIAIGVLYGVTGTLNMADLAVRVAAVGPEDAALVQAGGLLLLVVFALKAALVPFQFWLPPAYASASAPVAALFAIMTKVGAYAIIRIYTLVFGEEAGLLAGIATDWLLPAALLTVIIGMIGILASRDLRSIVAYLVVLSIGTLLAGVGLFNGVGLAAALYYLIHTTLVTGGLFLVADLIGAQRAPGTRLVPGNRLTQSALLGGLFMVGAIAVVGMPPLSGLIGKLLILRAAEGHAWMAWTWAVILLSGLGGLLALSRAGSLIFWRAEPDGESRPAAPAAAWLPAAALLGSAPLLVIFAGEVTAFTQAVALQLLDPQNYIQGVLHAQPEVTR